MSDLDKLMACIEDGHQLLSVTTQDQLRDLFNTSKTHIADAFEGGVDGLLSRWAEHDMETTRAYLLWDYIARNIGELYNSYDLSRQVLDRGLKKKQAD
ncbi:MAG: hypothetical protein WA970_07775 [Gammaproteobacteria bacterium]